MRSIRCGAYGHRLRLAPRRLTRLPANERQPLGAIDCTPAAILYTDQSMIHPAAGEVETFVE